MIRPIQDLYNEYKHDICVVVPFGGMNHIRNAIDNIVHRYNNRIIVIDSASEGNLTEQSFRDIHDKCDDSEIDCNKILLIQSNYNLENQYEEFCNKNRIKAKINLCVTEHKLESSVESFNFMPILPLVCLYFICCYLSAAFFGFNIFKLDSVTDSKDILLFLKLS